MYGTTVDKLIKTSFFVNGYCFNVMLGFPWSHIPIVLFIWRIWPLHANTILEPMPSYDTSVNTMEGLGKKKTNLVRSFIDEAILSLKKSSCCQGKALLYTSNSCSFQFMSMAGALFLCNSSLPHFINVKTFDLHTCSPFSLTPCTLLVGAVFGK